MGNDATQDRWMRKSDGVRKTEWIKGSNTQAPAGARRLVVEAVKKRSQP